MDIEKLFRSADFSKESDVKIRLEEKLGIEPDDSANEMNTTEKHVFIQEKPRHRKDKM